MTALSQATARFFARCFKRRTPPASDRANATLAHELMLELEDQQPAPLLLNLATGFPSALLCVLAAGTLAGALAGRQVGQPLDTIGRVQAAPPAQAASAEARELQALAHAPGPALQLPLGDGRPR